MKLLKICFICLGLAIISSCAKNSFVVNKPVLDPFTIYSYPTLALPPLYYLSSQEIADERRFVRKQNENVKSILLGNPMLLNKDNNVSGARSNLTEGDKKLLSLAGADKDFVNIRETINTESVGIIKKNDNFISSIFSNNSKDKLDDRLAQYVKHNKIFT